MRNVKLRTHTQSLLWSISIQNFTSMSGISALTPLQILLKKGAFQKFRGEAVLSLLDYCLPTFFFSFFFYSKLKESAAIVLWTLLNSACHSWLESRMQSGHEDNLETCYAIRLCKTGQKYQRNLWNATNCQWINLYKFTSQRWASKLTPTLLPTVQIFAPCDFWLFPAKLKEAVTRVLGTFTWNELP